MFDLKDAADARMEVTACRKAQPKVYIRSIAFDVTRGFDTTRLSCIVNRAAKEPEAMFA